MYSSVKWWSVNTAFVWLNRRKFPRQDAVADPAAQDLIESEQRTSESRQKRLRLPAYQQPDHAVHAFLHRPDAKRRRRRFAPRFAVRVQHALSQRRVHETGIDHTDMDAGAA